MKPASSPPSPGSPRRGVSLVALVGLWACAGPPAPVTPARDPARTTELALFMKDRVNPPFSELSFLLFHDDEREQEVAPSALAASANELALAADRLAGWPELPGESEESKLVFHEYAGSLKADTDRLVESLRDTQIDNTRLAFEALHGKCDACHHFFRYDQSPVMGRRDAASRPRPPRAD